MTDLVSEVVCRNKTDKINEDGQFVGSGVGSRAQSEVDKNVS